jgi:hypothetical protein
MDAHEATKYGTAEDLSMYLIDIDPEELDDLPPLAVINGNIDTLSFLLNNGIGDPVELLEMAEEEDDIDMITYLRGIVGLDDEEYRDDGWEEYNRGEEEEERPYSTIRPIYDSEIDEAIANDDLDFVKESLDVEMTDIEEVGEIAAYYGNYHILRYALKFGANDIPRMIRSAEKGGHTDVVDYLEQIE